MYQSAAYCSFDGKIYISGGLKRPELFISYDPSLKKFDFKLPQLPKGGRYGNSSICFGKKLYIIGGKTKSGVPMADMIVYDIEEKKFTEDPEMNVPRANFGIAFANSDIKDNEGAIYVFGGSQYLKNMEELLGSFPKLCNKHHSRPF